MPEDRPLTFLKYAVACSIVFNIISCPNRESLQLNATCRSCTQKNEDMASAAEGSTWIRLKRVRNTVRQNPQIYKLRYYIDNVTGPLVRVSLNELITGDPDI
jgi:hypothetical protein